MPASGGEATVASEAEELAHRQRRIARILARGALRAVALQREDKPDRSHASDAKEVDDAK